MKRCVCEIKDGYMNIPADDLQYDNDKDMCYVLIGYDGDSFEDSEKRLLQTMQLGFVPYAMLYRDENGNTDKEWRRFQREWCRPMIVGKKFREFCEKEEANR